MYELAHRNLHPPPGDGLRNRTLNYEALAAIRTIDLTTTGRRSGRPSRIEIWWHRVAERFIIAGTPGPRDWYANILANPSITVHPGGQDLPSTAIPIVDPALRRVVFSDPETAWYEARSDLESLVASAPLVEVRFQSGTASR